MPGVPGPGAGQPQQPLGHRSWDRREGTGLALENGSQRLVRVYWLNDSGQEIFYFELEPGQRGHLTTWTSHPWVFRDAASPAQQLAVQDQPVFYAPRLPPGTPSSRRWRAVIHEPRQQQWSPALHSLAGPRFRGAARTLLLCHRRLAAMRAGAASLPGRAWRGRLRSSSWLGAATLGDLPQVGVAAMGLHVHAHVLQGRGETLAQQLPSHSLLPSGAATAHPARGRAQSAPPAGPPPAGWDGPK